MSTNLDKVLVVTGTVFWTLGRIFWALFFLAALYKGYVDNLNENIRFFNGSMERILADYGSSVIFGFLAFSLLRCSIENSPFFSRNKGKKYSYFREFNFTNWIQFVEICRMNKTTVLNELWTKQNQPIGNNKKIKNKHSPAVSKHPRGLASNEFFEWLLPSSNGLGKSRLDKPQSAAFVILIHYCLNKLDGNPDWRNLEVDDTLKLIANHRTLFRQVNIDARVISFGRTRMESPDAVSYYLEAAAEEIVSKFQENQAKPNLDDILINDIVRWRIL